MSGLSRLATLTGIAFALPMLASALAQDGNPAQTVTIEIRKVMAVGDAKPVIVLEEVATGPRRIVAQDVKPADKAAAKPDDTKRRDIIAQAVRAIEKVVVGKPVQAVPAQKMVILRQAIRRAPGVPVDPDMDPMAAQWLAQFTPMVRTEVHFLLTVAEATPEQRKAIVAVRTKAAKDASKLYAQSQQRMGRFQNNAQYPQPKSLVQETVTNLAKPILSAEQMERYQAELKRRADDQKSLAIKNIIARMDQDLVLSADQREKFEAVLAKNWNQSWGQSLETFMYGDQFFPAIPDNVVLPILNPKQAAVWRGTQKNNGMMFGGFSFNNQIEGADLFPMDEEPEQPKMDAIKVAPAGRDQVKNVIIIDLPREDVPAAPEKAVAKDEAKPAGEKPKDAPVDKPKDAATPKPK